MALNLTVLILVLAITFMHSIFGFFSGLINVFCSVASAAIAFGFYEALNDFATSSFAGEYTSYTEPVCFLGLFLGSMAALRSLADNYIRGNVKLPTPVDVSGAAICGFINAQIFVGTLVLGLMMLPIGGSVLGFSAWERNAYDEKDPDHPGVSKFDRQSLWTRSDAFAAGLFNLLSRGSMRGEVVFASVYPDFSEAVFFSTNTVQPESSPSPYRAERGRKSDGFKQGLRVKGWWEDSEAVETRYRERPPTEKETRPDFSRLTVQPAAGKKWIVTKLELDSKSADRSERSSLHLFRPTMLRLVGQTDEEEYSQHTPLILANADDTLNGQHRCVDFDSNFSLESTPDPIYAYFEVDQSFEPHFVEYRRHARAAMPPGQSEDREIVLTLGGVSEQRNAQTPTFARSLERGSGVNSKLPFEMSPRAIQGQGDSTLAGGEFAYGRIFGSVDRLQHTGDGPSVEELKVPEGHRIVQIRYRPKRVQSIVGQVFNFVGQLSQYYLEDSSAERYPMAGYYAIVSREQGRRYMELYYTGGPDTELGASFRNMLDFKDVQRQEVNDSDETIVGLLFIVPSGHEIVRVINNAGEGSEVHYTVR